MTGQQPNYFSYLLRLWQVENDGKQTWRASLEDPVSRKRRGFANLKELVDFLKAQTGEPMDEESSGKL